MESKSIRNNSRFIILLCSCLFRFAAGFAQDNMDQWPAAVLSAANTAEHASYLSAEEKKAVFYLNLIRLDGPLFANTFLKSYMDTCHEKIEDRYIQSLRRELAALEPLPVFSPAQDLYGEADDHAREMGKSGKVGHNSASGKNFRGRMMKFSKTYKSVGENCDYGNNTGFNVVLSLLIDQGVSDLGHRRNILNREYIYTGISIHPHQKYRFNCVMDFGGELLKGN